MNIRYWYLLLAGLAIAFRAIGCSMADDRTAAPRLSSFILVGEATLESTGETILQVAGGPSIGGVTGLCVKDSTFVVLDEGLTDLAYEYSRQGRFLHVIGQRGRGEAGYVRPHRNAVQATKDGRLYLYDSATGNTKVYDSQGSLVSNLGQRLMPTQWLRINSSGDLFQVNEQKGIAYLRKLKADLDVVWSITLTSPGEEVLVLHFPLQSGLCLSEKRQRAYYLASGAYLVNEIDLSSGTVVAKFGYKPDGYRELPEEFWHAGASAPPEDAKRIIAGTSLLYGGMFLLADRYLFVAGLGVAGNKEAAWFVYDLDNMGEIYELGASDRGMLEGGALRLLDCRDDLLYAYREPADSELDTSNGRIVTFRLSFNRSGG